MTSSHRSSCQSGLRSAVSSVKSTCAKKSLGSSLLAAGNEAHVAEQLVAAAGRERGRRDVRAPVPACGPDTTTIAPRLAEVAPARRRGRQRRGQELLAQALLPAAVGQLLLRGLGGEAGDEAFLGRHRAGSLVAAAGAYALTRRAAAAAASSGATMLRLSSVDSSRPARCVRRGITSIRQQKSSAPRGAVRTHRFSGGLEPRWRARRRRPSCSSAAPDGPSSSKRARGARGASISWNGRREAYGAISTASSSIATMRSRAAHLLGDEVAEQALAHRARRVGAGALALARDAPRARSRARTAARACAAATRRPRGAR